MKYIAIFLLMMVYTGSIHAQSKDEQEILQILDNQIASWNKGDLDSFMAGYWNNDSLMFVGKSEITYGYQNTLSRYKRSYPDTAAMGKLSFHVVQVKKLSPQYYFVTGQWLLTRSAGDLKGHYTLLIRKINGAWKIVTDHSS